MFKKIFKKLFRKNQDTSISFKQGFDLTDLPVITLYQGEKKFNFILDTGSTHSVINRDVLKQLEYNERPGHGELVGMEGNPVKTSVCDITFSYKDIQFSYTYMVNDLSAVFETIKRNSGVNLHGVIGSRFFNEYKYVLDFDELIAYSKA